MRNLDTITTSEMTKEEWLAFEKAWIAQFAESLVIECDVSKEDAGEIAEGHWDNYCNQEGWHGRNEAILIKRSGIYT